MQRTYKFLNLLKIFYNSLCTLFTKLRNMLDYSFSNSSAEQLNNDSSSDRLFHTSSINDSSLSVSEEENLYKDEPFDVTEDASQKHMALRASTAPARPLTSLE